MQMMLVVVMGLFPMSILFPTLKTGPKVLGIVFKCSKFSVVIHNLSPQILCVFVVKTTNLVAKERRSSYNNSSNSNNKEVTKVLC